MATDVCGWWEAECPVFGARLAYRDIRSPAFASGRYEPIADVYHSKQSICTERATEALSDKRLPLLLLAAPFPRTRDAPGNLPMLCPDHG